MSTTVLDAALAYIRQGFAVVPVPYRKKGPTIEAWQTLRIAAEDAPQYFNGAPQNIGIILGEASDGATDLDLDCPEAIAAAPYLLLRTAVFGHESKRVSHWIYKTNLAETQDRAAIKFMSADKRGLLEVRVGGADRGCQTIFPPSIHVSGEPISWEDARDEIREVNGAELLRYASRLASAAQLAIAFPQVGGRHDAAFVLGGFLTRCRFDIPLIKLFVEAVAIASGQPGDKRRDMIRTAVDGAECAKPAGLPVLAETFGDNPAKLVAKWLGYRGGAQPAGEHSNGETRKHILEVRITEDGLALEFVDRHGHAFRYVALWARWLKWAGTHWENENTLAVYDEARKICREAAQWFKDQNEAPPSHLAKAKTFAATEIIARSDRRVASTTEQWDRDELLFNTREGSASLEEEPW